MRLHLLIVAFILFTLNLSAQDVFLRYPKPLSLSSSTNDTISRSPIDVHISMGTEVRVGGGTTSSLFWISPKIGYQVSPKVRISTGFIYGTDLFGTSKKFPNTTSVSLAPYKNPQKNNFVNVYGRAEFMPNSRLWIATTFSYQNGLMNNFYYPYVASFFNDVDIFSMNAEMQYQLTEHSFIYIGIDFSFIDYSNNCSPVGGNDIFFNSNQQKSFGITPSYSNSMRRLP